MEISMVWRFIHSECQWFLYAQTQLWTEGNEYHFKIKRLHIKADIQATPFVFHSLLAPKGGLYWCFSEFGSPLLVIGIILGNKRKRLGYPLIFRAPQFWVVLCVWIIISSEIGLCSRERNRGIKCLEWNRICQYSPEKYSCIIMQLRNTLWSLFILDWVNKSPVKTCKVSNTSAKGRCPSRCRSASGSLWT